MIEMYDQFEWSMDMKMWKIQKGKINSWFKWSIDLKMVKCIIDYNHDQKRSKKLG